MRGKSKQAYTVKLTKQGYERLRAAADERGMFMAKLLDLAIESYLQSSKGQAA